MISTSSLEFFVRWFRAYPRRSALMVFLLALAGLAEGVGVVTLLPLLEVADSGGRPDSRIGELIVGALEGTGLSPSTAMLLTVIVVAMTLKAGFIWTAYRQVGYTVARVTRDLRVRLMAAVLQARWTYLANRPAGRFANAVSSEALRAAWAYREACTVIADLFLIGVYLTLSTLISWRLTLFALVSGAVLAFALRGFVQMSRSAGLEQTQLIRSLSRRLVDVLRGIKSIKAMAREKLVLPLLEQETEGLNQAQRRQVLAAQGLKLFQEPALTLLLVCAIFVLLEIGDQPLEAVLVVAFVFYRLMGKFNAVQGRFQSLVVGESAYYSIIEQTEEAEALEEREQGKPIDGLHKEIRLEGVTFGYEDSRPPVLRDVHVAIPPGAFVAIYGESGSGKTTLVDIVLGLHRPDSGEVWIDDRPLAQISLRSWREHVGYVPQELLLFNDSILQNVTLGDDSLDRDDVERALRLAEAWEFVSGRDEGMDTMVGEHGAMLSGGQRQRIAIARALVRRPSLLVLDEVTTALDPETERELCATFRRLRGEVTILSISHQPAMREAADVTYLLRDGRLMTSDDRVGVGD